MLSQAHRRSIHTSLEPILGEEETDALMSEFPASEGDMSVTTTHFDATITRLEHRMDLGFANHQTAMEKAIGNAFRTMMIALATALVGGMGLAAAIAAGVAQAVAGGSP